jgi:ankyrin repeat protein
MIACALGHEEVVGKLLAAGADVSISYKGQTALLFAHQQGHKAIVRSILVTEYYVDMIRQQIELISAMDFSLEDEKQAEDLQGCWQGDCQPS